MVAAAQRVVRSEEEQRSGSGRRTERDLKQERQRRRKEEADMGSLTQKNRPTLPLAMASDRSLSSVSPSSRAPPESPCLAMAGAGSSTTIHRLLPIRSARPRERFSDLLTMIDGKSMATLTDNTLWVFELRARVLAQQSSLLMRLELCVT